MAKRSPLFPCHHWNGHFEEWEYKGLQHPSGQVVKRTEKYVITYYTNMFKKYPRYYEGKEYKGNGE